MTTSDITLWQHTIAEPAVMVGAGLHSGRPCRMALRPAEPDAGLVFVRRDLTGDNRIPARAANVADTRLGTTLRGAGGAEVATVEHLMAAFAGLGVDNAVIELDGPEIPAADGSSAPFAALLRRAGLRRQGAPRRAIKVLREISVEHDGKRAAFLPADRAGLDVSIDFPEPIGAQRFTFEFVEGAFEAQLAPARTFGFREDAERLRASGRGLGASHDNTVVIEDGAVSNPDGLRFPNEFVRHKALDALGDLSLAGAPILGRYVAFKPGHALNLALLDALLADRGAWRWDGVPAAAAPRAG